MDEKMDLEVLLMLKHKKRKKFWSRIVSVLMCLVVFCTTYALILPAITMEGDTFCGIEAHTHTEDCYNQTLLCQTHVHTDACYLRQGEQICELAESAGHTHTETCIPQTQMILTCGQEEVAAHSHTDECSCAEQVLSCGQEETLGHTHGEQCVTKSLQCTLPEDENHIHSDGCYVDTMICGQDEIPAHSHGDDCYTTVTTNLCGLEENAGHSHTDACYTPVTIYSCGMEESEAHTHTDACYEMTQEQICTIETDPEHEHTEACYDKQLVCELEEHEHSLPCYADPNADVETAANWEATLPELTGEYAGDVLAIAKSQLGYTESERNYIVSESGETKGYTRYGAWYGIPYGDWCAMFVSFCLDYAGVEDFPLDANCPNWINALTEKQMYAVAENYTPAAGDIIFFDWNANELADHVGIVAEYIPATDTTVAQVKTIEGNAGNIVRYNTYNLADSTILGYGILPQKLTEEEEIQVNQVIAMIEAMPSADEIDAKVEEFAAAGDEEGEIAYLEATYQQVAEAYYYYEQLPEALKRYVINAEKLLELEYIWSVTPYLNAIVSDNPTTVGKTGTDPVASTSEFVKLNVYDYYGDASAASAGKTTINSLWKSNKKYPGFQWNGGAHMTSAAFTRWRVDNIDFGNSMITDYTYGGTTSGITNGVTQNYQHIGRQGGAVNNIVEYPTGYWANKPLGLSTGSSVMLPTLKNNYPALSDGTSLKYLFSESTYASQKNTANVDGLFRQNEESGEYWFDSRENHAQYSSNKFTLYNQIITPNFILYPFGNFLPFSDINNDDQITQVSKIDSVVQKNPNISGSVGYMQTIINRLLEGSEDAAENQLISMLAKYRDSLSTSTTAAGSRYTLTVEEALEYYFDNSPEFKNENPNFNSADMQALLDKLYNIDFDVKKNFFFGMDMQMNFLQPRGGMTGNDNDNDGQPDYPMRFYFAGDDDVWVYIDNVLFLDLTGIHRHVGGEIDFVNGVVKYYSMKSYIDGAVSDTPYYTMSFADVLMKNGGVAQADLGNYLKYENGKYTTFKDYTFHSFNFYFMERGSGSSVCRINFNFPLLRQNTISVNKENAYIAKGLSVEDTQVLGNPDYYFNLVTPSNTLFVGPNSETGVSEYTVKNRDGTLVKNDDGTVKVFQTDKYGIFTLKAGQTAIFDGVGENEGIYFVQELIKDEDNGQYPSVYINDVISRHNEKINWSHRKYFSETDEFNADDPTIGPYGYRWYGRSGQDTDASTDVTFFFKQQNHLDVDQLGTLSVTKVLNAEDTGQTFNMEVILDGEKLPVGTKYTLDGEEKTVETEGILPLQAGQTAELANIISGTQYTVTELNGGDYTVTYQAENSDETQINGSITGVVRTATDVLVTVNNTEKGTEVDIPVTKSFAKSGADTASHSYTFKLEQVTDSTGTTTVADGTILEYTAAFEGNSTAFVFTLPYLKHEIGTLPATFYYRIKETGMEADVLSNNQMFVAQIKVEEEGTGIKAVLETVHGSSTGSADFVNTLIGDLKLQKIVDGSTEARNTETFDFVMKLDSADSNVTLPGSYNAVLVAADGSITEETVNLRDDNSIGIKNVMHNESVTICGIPIGTAWTITESDPEGYTVTTKTTVGETTVEGSSAKISGSIVPGLTQVVFINQQGYALPETGGTGTHMYTMAGLLLMLTSVAYLLYKWKRRGREVS